MHRIDELLEANERYVASGGPAPSVDGRPTRHFAVVTCMDARIDVFAVLGLNVGESMVLRNAGGRITEDVLRSLALAIHVLGVDEVIVMQHTGCGLTGVTDEELQLQTGSDVDFLAIDDHEAALRRDLDVLVSTPYLQGIRVVAGLVYDVTSGKVQEMDRRAREDA
jgi:carbonic anhydrase